MRTVLILGSVVLLALAPAAAHSQDSTIAAPAPPTPPASGDVRFTSITAGGSHSCGLTAEGIAYCWGHNDVGQLGDSTNTDRTAPVPVVGGITFKLLSAGDHHTCGIDTDNVPYCWGGNESGQLGTGTTAKWNMPVRVGSFRFAAISAGTHHTCGTLVHWERQDRMMCWGSNEHGQLGTRDTRHSWIPVASFGTIRYRAVAAGPQHTCAATQQGNVFCWGGNSKGQLGNGSRTQSPVPFLIRVTRKENFVGVTAGTSHSCALTEPGELYCWGDNGAGQLGTGKGGSAIIPARLKDTPQFKLLSAGGDATCGVHGENVVACWGSNAAGQFGTAPDAGSKTPQPALSGLAFTMIALGREHACGVQADGSAYCWGAGAVGQLGNGAIVTNAQPVRVGTPP
jgi:alpha-tubulin suppressor-like RCC1 family protein